MSASRYDPGSGPCAPWSRPPDHSAHPCRGVSGIAQSGDRVAGPSHHVVASDPRRSRAATRPCYSPWFALRGANGRRSGPGRPISTGSAVIPLPRERNEGRAGPPSSVRSLGSDGLSPVLTAFEPLPAEGRDAAAEAVADDAAAVRPGWPTHPLGSEGHPPPAGPPAVGVRLDHRTRPVPHHPAPRLTGRRRPLVAPGLAGACPRPRPGIPRRPRSVSHGRESRSHAPPGRPSADPAAVPTLIGPLKLECRWIRAEAVSAAGAAPFGRDQRRPSSMGRPASARQSIAAVAARAARGDRIQAGSIA